jgi:hypothetical protein
MANLEQLVKPELINKVTGTGLGTIGVSNVWGWLGTNQEAITGLCGIAGLILTAIGVGFTIYKSLKG